MLLRLLLLRLDSKACQTSTNTQVAFKWLHIILKSTQLAVIYTTHLDDEFGHGFSCFACMRCGGENGTNGHHLAIFSVDMAFSHHFVAPHHTLYPPTLLEGLWYWLH